MILDQLFEEQARGIRLRDGAGMYDGRVEVFDYYKEKWSKVYYRSSTDEARYFDQIENYCQRNYFKCIWYFSGWHADNLVFMADNCVDTLRTIIRKQYNLSVMAKKRTCLIVIGPLDLTLQS